MGVTPTPLSSIPVTILSRNGRVDGRIVHAAPDWVDVCAEDRFERISNMDVRVICPVVVGDYVERKFALGRMLASIDADFREEAADVANLTTKPGPGVHMAAELWDILDRIARETANPDSKTGLDGGAQ